MKEAQPVPSAIQQLHDLEVQGAIGWPVEAKIIVRLGCPLKDEFESEALVRSFAEAEAWFRKARDIRYDTGEIRLPPASELQRSSVVDELFTAGVPGTALWVYEGMFQATFADPSDTSAGRNWIDAESWAELEDKMRMAV